MARGVKVYPGMPRPADIADQALDYAAETQARADSRYDALVTEHKDKLVAATKSQKQTNPQGGTVKMSLSGPTKRRR